MPDVEGFACISPVSLDALGLLRLHFQGTWVGDFPDPPTTCALPQGVEMTEQSEGVKRDSTYIPTCHRVP